MNSTSNATGGARPLATAFTLSSAGLSGVSAFKAVTHLPKNRALSCAFGALSAVSAIFSGSSAIAYWTSPSEAISDYMPNLGKTFANVTMATAAYAGAAIGNALLEGFTSALREEINTATHGALRSSRNN